MLLTKEVEITINGNFINYYKERGYTVFNKKTTVLVEHLPSTSKAEIKVKCDNCEHEHIIKYYNYNNNIIKNNGKYYCTYCKIERIEKTNIEKYGVKSTLSDNTIRNKIKQTNIKRYNAEYPLQNKDIMNKLKNTNINRYGTKVSLLNKDVKEKAKNTMLLKYNTLHALQSEKCINKKTETSNKRYGFDSYSKTQSFKDKINIKILNKYNNGNINMLSIHDDYYTIMCKENHTYSIHKDLFKLRRLRCNEICTICNPLNSNKSDSENKLYNFIKENYGGEIIQNNRTQIGLELDIYLPELNLAFEFNGLYWHNELNKYNNYHKEKSDLCDKKGIQLIHIWEDEWTHKQEIIQSMILNKLGKSENKIYGRQTIIKEITDNKLIRSFLDSNHIQGFVGSQIKLGLFYNDELVSLMTFGKPRKNMNSVSKNNNDYEMLRFCNKLNTNVIGSASKLFKYFLKTYNPSQITTYADRSYSNGNLYKQLGFGFIHITQPNYYYIINGFRYYRFSFRKDILIKQGYDKNKTEHEIMLERKIYRIYNAGNYKFIYNK